MIKVTGKILIEDSLEITHVKVFNIDDIPISQLAHDHDRQITDYQKDKTTIA